MFFKSHPDFFKVEDVVKDSDDNGNEYNRVQTEYHLNTSINNDSINVYIIEETYEDYTVHIYINGTEELEMSGFGTSEKAKNFAYGFLMWFECKKNLIVDLLLKQL